MEYKYTKATAIRRIRELDPSLSFASDEDVWRTLTNVAPEVVGKIDPESYKGGGYSYTRESALKKVRAADPGLAGVGDGELWTTLTNVAPEVLGKIDPESYGGGKKGEIADSGSEKGGGGALSRLLALAAGLPEQDYVRSAGELEQGRGARGEVADSGSEKGGGGALSRLLALAAGLPERDYVRSAGELEQGRLDAKARRGAELDAEARMTQAELRAKRTGEPVRERWYDPIFDGLRTGVLSGVESAGRSVKMARDAERLRDERQASGEDEGEMGPPGTELLRDLLFRTALEKGTPGAEKVADEAGGMAGAVSPSARKTPKPMEEYWGGGEKGKAVERVAWLSVENMPQLAAILAAQATGLGEAALIGMGVQSAAQKYDQLGQEMPDMPVEDRLTNATITGGLEAGSEKVFGVGRWGRELVSAARKALLKEAAVEATRAEMKQAVAREIGKNVLAGAKIPVEEGAEEIISQFGENVTDRAQGVTRGGRAVTLADGLLESGAVGAVASSPMGVARAAQPVRVREIEGPERPAPEVLARMALTQAAGEEMATKGTKGEVPEAPQGEGGERPGPEVLARLALAQAAGGEEEISDVTSERKEEGAPEDERAQKARELLGLLQKVAEEKAAGGEEEISDVTSERKEEGAPVSAVELLKKRNDLVRSGTGSGGELAELDRKIEDELTGKGEERRRVEAIEKVQAGLDDLKGQLNDMLGAKGEPSKTEMIDRGLSPVPVAEGASPGVAPLPPEATVPAPVEVGSAEGVKVVADDGTRPVPGRSDLNYSVRKLSVEERKDPVASGRLYKAVVRRVNPFKSVAGYGYTPEGAFDSAMGVWVEDEERKVGGMRTPQVAPPDLAGQGEVERLWGALKETGEPIARKSAETLAAVLGGEVTPDVIHKNGILHPDNKNMRRVFTAETGVKLPKTVKGTKEAVGRWALEREAGAKLEPVKQKEGETPAEEPVETEESEKVGQTVAEKGNLPVETAEVWPENFGEEPDGSTRAMRFGWDRPNAASRARMLEKADGQSAAGVAALAGGRLDDASRALADFQFWREAAEASLAREGGEQDFEAYRNRVRGEVVSDEGAEVQERGGAEGVAEGASAGSAGVVPGTEGGAAGTASGKEVGNGQAGNMGERKRVGKGKAGLPGGAGGTAAGTNAEGQQSGGGPGAVGGDGGTGAEAGGTAGAVRTGGDGAGAGRGGPGGTAGLGEEGGGPAGTDTRGAGNAGEVEAGKRADVGDAGAGNYSIPDGEEPFPKGAVGKARANLDALRILKTLEAELRPATVEEQKKLAAYTGWGGLADVFDRAADPDGSGYYRDEEKIKTWGKMFRALRELLTDEEYAAARASTINAHYTSMTVTDGMWKLAERLGFRGGRVGEFGAGIGNFLGRTPAGLKRGVKWTAVELDSVSGRMLKFLYPAATVHVAGLEKTKIPAGSLDMVIGNFPFAAEGPYDRNYPPMALHNYFFARAVDAVKPGGLVVAVTSTGIMDAGKSLAVRKLLGEKADLVGAMRLPNNAFKENAGTQVTTDIIILRKRGVKRFDGAQKWTTTRMVETADGEHEAAVNEYYADHPEMILGRLLLDEGQYREMEPGVAPIPGKKLVDQIAEATEKLPADVMGVEKLAAGSSAEFEGEAADPGKREGELVRRTDGIYQVRDGVLVKPNWGAAETGRADSYMAVRDALATLRAAQLSETADERKVDGDRKALNVAYDKHVKKYGPVSNTRTHGYLEEDPEFRLVTGLELKMDGWEKDRKGVMRRVTTYGKAPIFSQRTQWPWRAPEKAESAEQAAVLARAYFGGLDLGKVAELLGKTEEEARGALLATGKFFENPKTGALEDEAEYLSGNVRGKLGEAEEAAEDSDRFARNVEALRKVQPKDLTIDEVPLRLGATWVPGKVVAGWIEALFGGEYRVGVRVEPITGTWDVVVQGYTGRGELQIPKNVSLGSGEVTALDLIRAGLNLKREPVYDQWEDPDGTTHRQINQEKTLAARAAQRALEEKFEKWAKKNHGEVLAEIYNREFNSHRDKEWSGDTPWEVYPGAADFKMKGRRFVLRNHQRSAVARAIEESVVLAHGVGSGKTAIQTTIAMEWKRLGLAKKTVIAVQNSTLEQFADFVPLLYPNAKLLVARKQDLEKQNRKQFMGRIANGDWDIIIMAHSQVDLLPHKPEAVDAYRREQLAELEQAIQEKKAAEGKSSTGKRAVKALEHAKKSLEAHLDRLLDSAKDQTIFWEDLGIDGLILDEAHLYKKRFFVTKMDRVKGLDTGASKRGMGMGLKTDSVLAKTGGRNVVFATGTPITNTLAEVWNMIRFVRPAKLREWGVEGFDRFASTFCNTEVKGERDSGGRYRMVERFSVFQGVPELRRLVRSVLDVRLNEDLPDVPRPPVKGGKAELVEVPATGLLGKMMEYIRDTYVWFEGLSGQAKMAHSSVPLELYTLSRKAAVDMRMIWSGARNDPETKLNSAAKRIHEIWKATEDNKGTQAVFLDLRKGAGGFNAWEALRDRLVELGIPRDEVATVDDVSKVKRKELWDRVNSGSVRVVIGSRSTMGVGVNIQDRGAYVHHLDAAMRPDWMEQAEGRFVRQGNLYADLGGVGIVRWGTLDTLDAGLYQMLSRKQAMMNQALRADGGDRNISDPGGVISYEEAAALLSNNPDLVKKAELSVRLGELRAIRDSWNVSQGTVREQLNIKKEAVARGKPIGDGIEKWLKKHPAFKAGEVAELTWGDEGAKGHEAVLKLLERKIEAGKKTAKDNLARMVEQNQEAFKSRRAGSKATDPTEARTGVVAVRFGGVEVRASIVYSSLSADSGVVEWMFAGDFPETGWGLGSYGQSGRATTAEGLLASVARVRGNLDGELRERRETIAGEERRIVELSGLLDQPWEQEGELDRVERELVDVEERLKASGVEAEKKKVEARPQLKDYLEAELTEEELAALAGEDEDVDADTAGGPVEEEQGGKRGAGSGGGAPAADVPAEGGQPGGGVRGETAEERRERVGEGYSAADDNERVAVSLPALVEIHKRLLGGRAPKVLKFLKTRRLAERLGVFQGDAGVTVKARLFETVPPDVRAALLDEAKAKATTTGGDVQAIYRGLLKEERRKWDVPVEALQVLGHEIGHAFDWLDDRETARGNLLGHVAGLVKFMKQSIPLQSGAAVALSDATRDRLRRQAARMVGTGDKAAIQAKYRELLKAELEKQGLVGLKEIRDELTALSEWWNPYDPAAVDDGYLEYRARSEELMADALSVLLNNPEALQKRAPKFVELFFGWLVKKPEVRKVYEAIQRELKEGAEAGSLTDKILKGYQEHEAKLLAARAAGRQSLHDKLMALKAGVLDVHYPTRALVRESEDETGIKEGSDRDPALSIEESIYVGAELELYGKELKRTVIRVLDKARVSWESFGLWMQMQRIVEGDRRGLANPYGVTPVEAKRILEDLEKKAGSALREAQEAFWRLRQEQVVAEMQAAGMYAPELLEAVRDNWAYVTFDVTRHLEQRYGDGVGGHIHRQVGTLESIGNPATATVLKDAAIISAIRRNAAKRDEVSFLRDVGEAKPATMRWVNDHREPVAPGDRRQGLVVFLENGKVSAWYVPKLIAQAWNHEPPMVVAMIGRVMKYLGGGFFRTMYVDVRPGFWCLTMFRDFMKMFRGVKEMGPFGAGKAWLKGVKPAFQSIFSDAVSEAEKAMLENGALIASGYSSGDSEADSALVRHLERYGVEVRGPATGMAKALRPVKAVVRALAMPIRKWMEIGRAVARIPKFGAWQYLEKNRPDLTERERAHIVRWQAGDPAFLVRGLYSPITNNLWLFSDAMKNGWLAEAELVRQSPGTWAWKLAVTALLPKLVRFGIKAGVVGAGVVLTLKPFGDDDDKEDPRKVTLKDLFGNIGEYDLANYDCYPIGVTRTGKTVYVRVPVDQQTQLVGGLLWKGLGAATGGGVDGAAGVLDYAGGQVPGLAPAFKLAELWWGVASGQNVYDSFRGRMLFSDDEMAAGGMRKVERAAKETANTMGVGIVYAFRGDSEKDVLTELERVLKTAGIQDTVGRFLKVSDRGMHERFASARGKVAAEEAEARLTARDMAKEFADAGAIGLADAVRKIAAGKIEKLTPEEGKVLAEKYEYIDRTLKATMTGRYGGVWVQELEAAKTTKEKLAVVRELVKIRQEREAAENR